MPPIKFETMKYLNLTISFFIYLLVVSCAANEPVDKTQIKKEVSDAFDAYANHVNTNGLKGVEKYFSTDPDFFWVEDGQMQYPNHDSLLANINQFYPQVDSVHFKAFETKIDVIDRGLATLYAEYRQDVALKSGYAFTLDGAMTILLRKESDGWKFFNGHSSIKKPRGAN